MGIVYYIRGMDKKFAWSFLGFLLAVFFGGLNIYTEFIRVNTPSVFVEVVSDASVFDVKEDVGELEIFYDDVDIKSLNKTLSVIFVKIGNEGGAPVLKGYYDGEYPFNLSLMDGTVLKVEQVNATSEYLKSSAIPIIKDSNNIILPEVILEPSESYSIKMLVLHSSKASAEIDVTGKIAGSNEIFLYQLNNEKDELSFWEEVFYGGWEVQLARLPIYFFGLIIFVIFVIIPLALVSQFFIKIKREKIISLYKRYYNVDADELDVLIFNCYLKSGLSPLVKATEKLSVPGFAGGSLLLRQSAEAHESPNNAERMVKESSAYSDAIAEKLLDKIISLYKLHDNVNSDYKMAVVRLNDFIKFVVIKES